MKKPGEIKNMRNFLNNSNVFNPSKAESGFVCKKNTDIDFHEDQKNCAISNEE
jgi:hypothetical protein